MLHSELCFAKLVLAVHKGVDPRRAGLVMVAQPLTWQCFLLFGRLSDRFEARISGIRGDDDNRGEPPF